MRNAEATPTMFELVQPHLTAEDDVLLWKIALEVVSSEVDLFALGRKNPAKQFLRIGRCSHWFRPHQSRWTAMGGFAWPSGWQNTSGAGLSHNGLPELDWTVLLEKVDGEWRAAQKFAGKDRSEVRVSIPARTARHNQAVIHTLWNPGNERVFYGFRKQNDTWQLVAFNDLGENCSSRTART